MLISLVSFDVFGKKYALVIGGASKLTEPDHHEFARNSILASKGLASKGYVVQSLFGSPISNDSERTKYKEDYSYFERMASSQESLTIQNSSPSTIDTYFANLISSVKEGDQVEIYLIAHGEDSCGEIGVHIKKDIGSGCNHTFTIFNDKGDKIQYSTDSIFRYLKQLEDKGALPNIVLSSCHAGRAKNLMSKYNLQKTCAFFQTAGNSEGYGCFESDPDFNTDHTSSSEFLAMRYYQDSLDKILTEDYFKSKNFHCLKKIVDYKKDKSLDFSSMDSIFWSSRKIDLTFQESTLSSLLEIPYFTGESLSFLLRTETPISCHQANTSFNPLIAELEKTATDTTKAMLTNHLNTFNSAREKYNLSLTKQRELVEKYNSANEEEKVQMIEPINKAQSETLENAKAVQLAERALVDYFHSFFTPPNSNCKRTL